MTWFAFLGWRWLRPRGLRFTLRMRLTVCRFHYAAGAAAAATGSAAEIPPFARAQVERQSNIRTPAQWRRDTLPQNVLRTRFTSSENSMEVTRLRTVAIRMVIYGQPRLRGNCDVDTLATVIAGYA